MSQELTPREEREFDNFLRDNKSLGYQRAREIFLERVLKQQRLI